MHDGRGVIQMFKKSVWNRKVTDVELKELADNKKYVRYCGSRTTILYGGHLKFVQLKVDSFEVV